MERREFMRRAGLGTLGLALAGNEALPAAELAVKERRWVEMSEIPA